MASYQLGPESPRPFAVITENDVRRKVVLPVIPDYELYSFGDSYNNKMCELVHRYLELDTNDRLCYVGDNRGSLTAMLQEKFCLLEPVTTVIPGHIHYEESPNHRMLPMKVPNVGAEEYFLKAAKNKSQRKFDKILLKDSVRFFDEPRQTYKNILPTLTEFGKLVIIQRPADMTTLPISADAKERLVSQEPDYMETIRDLQACHLDVNWDIECLPIVMSKNHWYSMVKSKFPPQMEVISNFEVTSGLREISEGVLKYGEDQVEFVDRLLFITASRPVLNKIPQIARHGQPPHASNPLPPKATNIMTYNMEITPDITSLINEKKRQDRLLRGKSGYGHSKK